MMDEQRQVTLMSFGYRYDEMPAAQMVLDVRFLPNPYWVPELRPLDGRQPAIADYVLDNETGREFLARLLPLLQFTLLRYPDQYRQPIDVAVGCTGGRHRSVAVAEKLAAQLRAAGYRVAVQHRDLARRPEEGKP